MKPKQLSTHLSDRRLLQRARAGSRHREQQAEAYRANDLMEFQHYLETRDVKLLATKRKNHVCIPKKPKQTTNKDAQRCENKDKLENKGLFSWLW